MSDAPDELDVLGKELDGRYRIDRLIGAGAMGAVYQGTQLAVGRPVAIKLLNAALKSHGEMRERFRVEAQAIAALSHPNCLTLYDFGYSDDLAALYMVVEFLDGQPLSALAKGGLPARTAMALAAQIAQVLVVAHAAGILHRDLKPENVMVVQGMDGPQAKVLDFGLARIFEDVSGGTRLTRHGQLFGTPAYMSPEQCHSAMEVGPPADVYALGISMFEMLCGRLPFDSQSVPELLVMHSTHPAPPLTAGPDVPPEVTALVARMLAKNPADRPTAAQTAATLTAVLDGREAPTLPALLVPGPDAAFGEQPTVAPSAPGAPTSTNIDVPHKSAPGKALLGAGVFIVSLVIVFAVAWRMKPAPAAPAAPEQAVQIREAPAPPPPPAAPAIDPYQIIASDAVMRARADAVAASNGSAAEPEATADSEEAPADTLTAEDVLDAARARALKRKEQREKRNRAAAGKIREQIDRRGGKHRRSDN